MNPDIQIQMRFGTLCSLLMGAIHYGAHDLECLVEDVAAMKAAEFVKEAQKAEKFQDANALNAELMGALQALGTLPEGYCFCAENRDTLKPEAEHTGECRAARAVLAKMERK